ncbi:hypothetical protein MRB53_037401 [Persea americana]|nr:hypothetical protein MRB53_037401 [Persea americana]
MPDVNTIDIQTEIKWFMRPYLLDFLIEAHAAFQLLPETLYLAVNLLDRYCSKRIVYKKHYQLVGCATLLVAAKYGDRKERVPIVKELKSMCCGLYDDDMFLQMEWHVLVTLDWQVGHATVDSFLQMIYTDAPDDIEVEHMASYICELSLFHKDFVSVLPSILARSAYTLARWVLGRSSVPLPAWTQRYDTSILMNLINIAANPSPVVVQKYSEVRYSGVSRTMEAVLQEQAQLARQANPPAPSMTCPSQPLNPHYSLPLTPQKAPFTDDMPHGYITPPITPDGTFYNITSTTKLQEVMPRVCSGSPSPPSSIGHVHSIHYQPYVPSDLRYYA